MNTPSELRKLECLAKIYQIEMAGVNRYLHFSFMIMGYNRIPIQKWLREQSLESMDHAITIGEKITALGGKPPLTIFPVEELKHYTIDHILKDSLLFEEKSLNMYKELVALSEGDIALEEIARDFVRVEAEHLEKVRKMLKVDQ